MYKHIDTNICTQHLIAKKIIKENNKRRHGMNWTV